MITINVLLYVNTPKLIRLGHQGEHGVTHITIDYSVWKMQFGDGDIFAYAKRNGDDDVYEAAIIDNGHGQAMWDIEATDTEKAGFGSVEFQYKVGETILAKSDLFPTEVYRAMSGTPSSPGYTRALPFGGLLGQVLRKKSDEDFDVEWSDVEDGTKYYDSISRVGPYLFDVSFTEIQPYKTIPPVAMGCSSYVKDGKLYRNLDWDYSELASFHVHCPDFEGMSFISGLTNNHLDDELVGQLPYHIVDGINAHGIMVSTHVLYNDWGAYGTGEIPLTKLPYLALTRVKSMETLESDLDGVLDNLHVPAAMIATEYLIQVLVTDGITTAILRPGNSDAETYEIVDATTNPKLSNFRWVPDATVDRADLQNRPTGVERWNMMPCELSDLRFTRAYETPDRLSEFIGLRGTTKDSPDEVLEEIYDVAHALYEDRTRDGSTWQTMHSVVYSAQGMEHLWVQENWEKDYIAHSGGGTGLPDATVPGTAVIYDGNQWIAATGYPYVANGVAPDVELFRGTVTTGSIDEEITPVPFILTGLPNHTASYRVTFDETDYYCYGIYIGGMIIFTDVSDASGSALPFENMPFIIESEDGYAVVITEHGGEHNIIIYSSQTQMLTVTTEEITTPDGTIYTAELPIMLEPLIAGDSYHVRIGDVYEKTIEAITLDGVTALIDGNIFASDWQFGYMTGDDATMLVSTILGKQTVWITHTGGTVQIDLKYIPTTNQATYDSAVPFTSGGAATMYDKITSEMERKPRQVSHTETALSTMVSDNTIHRFTNMNRLTIRVPDYAFNAWCSVDFAGENPEIIFPTGTKFIGNKPNPAPGDHWEISLFRHGYYDSCIAICGRAVTE